MQELRLVETFSHRAFDKGDFTRCVKDVVATVINIGSTDKTHRRLTNYSPYPTYRRQNTQNQKCYHLYQVLMSNMVSNIVKDKEKKANDIKEGVTWYEGMGL